MLLDVLKGLPVALEKLILSSLFVQMVTLLLDFLLGVLYKSLKHARLSVELIYLLMVIEQVVRPMGSLRIQSREVYLSFVPSKLMVMLRQFLFLVRSDDPKAAVRDD